MSKRRVDIDFTEEGLAMVDGMAERLGKTRLEVVEQALDLFVACVRETMEGRVIGTGRTPPEIETFHDWNLGGYPPRPHRILLSPEDLPALAA